MYAPLLKSLTLAALLFAGAVSAAVNEGVHVVLETRLGTVVIAIDTERSPRAANYFLGYVDRGDYNGASLYRSASLDGQPMPQLVQGGLLSGALTSTGPVDPSAFGVASLLPTWDTTADSGLRHRRGSISLARDLLDTGQVIPEIVFCLRDIPRMDAGSSGRPDALGFPVIGEVLSGMDVIDAISRARLEGATSISFLEGQILSDPITITHAYRRQTEQAQATN
jgi:peptidyl-prolyl cis-trans isomerase A (cyclophilin A)